MNVLNVPGSMFISKVDNHNDVKKKILDELNGVNSTKYRMSDRLQEIYNSDFIMSEEYRAPYMDVVYQAVRQHLVDVSIALGSVSGMTVSRIWYQQYEQGNFHGWHNHPKSMFSSVYYVQLDGQSPSTTFKHIGQEFEVPVQEGMVLTFPSHMMHCSKPNQSNTIKTIVSFNSDITLGY